MVQDIRVLLDSELTTTVQDLRVLLDSELTTTVKDLDVWLDSELIMHDHMFSTLVSSLVLVLRPCDRTDKGAPLVTNQIPIPKYIPESDHLL